MKKQMMLLMAVGMMSGVMKCSEEGLSRFEAKKVSKSQGRERGKVMSKEAQERAEFQRQFEEGRQEARHAAAQRSADEAAGTGFGESAARAKDSFEKPGIFKRMKNWFDEWRYKRNNPGHEFDTHRKALKMQYDQDMQKRQNPDLVLNPDDIDQRASQYESDRARLEGLIQEEVQAGLSKNFTGSVDAKNARFNMMNPVGKDLLKRSAKDKRASLQQASTQLADID